MWSGRKAGVEELQPGQSFASLMYPMDGGGEMTVLCTLDGTVFHWSGFVGKPGAHDRFGVQVELGPLGTIRVSHCTHPCEGSERPWYEPWRTSAVRLLGVD
jgi:hypothetical protein